MRQNLSRFKNYKSPSSVRWRQWKRSFDQTVPSWSFWLESHLFGGATTSGAPFFSEHRRAPFPMTWPCDLGDWGPEHVWLGRRQIHRELHSPEVDSRSIFFPFSPVLFLSSSQWLWVMPRWREEPLFKQLSFGLRVWGMLIFVGYYDFFFFPLQLHQTLKTWW